MGHRTRSYVKHEREAAEAALQGVERELQTLTRCALLGEEAFDAAHPGNR